MRLGKNAQEIMFAAVQKNGLALEHVVPELDLNTGTGTAKSCESSYCASETCRIYVSLWAEAKHGGLALGNSIGIKAGHLP